MFWRNLTVAAIFVLVSGCAKAAQIDLDKSQSNHILRISGPIQNGDFEHFEQLVTEPASAWFDLLARVAWLSRHFK